MVVMVGGEFDNLLTSCHKPHRHVWVLTQRHSAKQSRHVLFIADVSLCLAGCLCAPPPAVFAQSSSCCVWRDLFIISEKKRERAGNVHYFLLCCQSEERLTPAGLLAGPFQMPSVWLSLTQRRLNFLSVCLSEAWVWCVGVCMAPSYSFGKVSVHTKPHCLITVWKQESLWIFSRKLMKH